MDSTSHFGSFLKSGINWVGERARNASFYLILATAGVIGLNYLEKQAEKSNLENHKIDNQNISFSVPSFFDVHSLEPSYDIKNQTTGTSYNIAGDFELSKNIKDNYELESFTKNGETYSIGDTAIYGSVVKDSLEKYEQKVNDFIDIAQQKKFGKNIENKLDSPSE